MQAERGRWFTPPDLLPQAMLRFDIELDNNVKVNLTELLARRSAIAAERGDKHD